MIQEFLLFVLSAVFHFGMVTKIESGYRCQSRDVLKYQADNAIVMLSRDNPRLTGTKPQEARVNF